MSSLKPTRRASRASGTGASGAEPTAITPHAVPSTMMGTPRAECLPAARASDAIVPGSSEQSSIRVGSPVSSTPPLILAPPTAPSRATRRPGTRAGTPPPPRHRRRVQDPYHFLHRCRADLLGRCPLRDKRGDSAQRSLLVGQPAEAVLSLSIRDRCRDELGESFEARLGALPQRLRAQRGYGQHAPDTHRDRNQIRDPR